MAGQLCYWRKPNQMWTEHTNFAQKGPALARNQTQHFFEPHLSYSPDCTALKFFVQNWRVDSWGMSACIHSPAEGCERLQQILRPFSSHMDKSLEAMAKAQSRPLLCQLLHSCRILSSHHQCYIQGKSISSQYSKIICVALDIRYPRANDCCMLKLLFPPPETYSRMEFVSVCCQTHYLSSKITLPLPHAWVARCMVQPQHHGHEQSACQCKQVFTFTDSRTHPLPPAFIPKNESEDGILAGCCIVHQKPEWIILAQRVLSLSTV